MDPEELQKLMDAMAAPDPESAEADLSVAPTEERLNSFLVDPGGFARNNPRTAGALQEGLQGAGVGFGTGGPAGAVVGGALGAATGALFPPRTPGERGASFGMDVAAGLAGGKGRLAQLLYRTIGAGAGAGIASGDPEEAFDAAVGTAAVGGVFAGLGKGTEQILGLAGKKSELGKLVGGGTKDAASKLGLAQALPENSVPSRIARGFQKVFGASFDKEGTSAAQELGFGALGAKALFGSGVAKFTPDAQEILTKGRANLKLRAKPNFQAYAQELKESGTKVAKTFTAEQGELNKAFNAYVDGGVKIDSKEGVDMVRRLAAAQNLFTPGTWNKFREAVLAKEILGPALKTVSGAKLLTQKSGMVVDTKVVSKNIESYRATSEGREVLNSLLPKRLGVKARNEFWDDLTVAFKQMHDFESAVEGSGLHYVGQKLFFQLIGPSAAAGAAAGGLGGEAVGGLASGVVAVVSLGAVLNTVMDSPRGAKMLLQLTEGDANAPRALMRLLVSNERLQGTRRDTQEGTFINIEDVENKKELEDAQQAGQTNLRTLGGAF